MFVLRYFYTNVLKDLYACRACGHKLTKHTSRFEKHLTKCKKYLQQAVESGNHNNITNHAFAFAKSPNQIKFPVLTTSDKDELDRLAASVSIIEGHPFTLFESQSMSAFLHRLNPAYKPPSRKVIAGPLLEEIYTNIKAKTEELLQSSDGLNIVTDESGNINHSRICNISIHTIYGTLHYISEDIGARRTDAVSYKNWLIDHLRVLTGNNFSRINSLATDTCSTMFQLWIQLRVLPDFRHVFFIPCDSHSIQLLVKDLLSLPRMKAIVDQAQVIAKAFRKAPLQYARLREFQREIYNKHYALILSVITRWGTQFRLINSVIKSKLALRRYGEMYTEKDIDEKAYDAITDSNFWRDVDLIRELLEPIDEGLKMSESSKTHLGHVLHRWMNFLKHLQRKVKDFPELKEFISPRNPKEKGTFPYRYNRQVAPIHVLAYFLRPDTTQLPISAEHEEIIYDFFKQYTRSQDEETTLCQEFQAYRGKLEPFTPDRVCWRYSQNPRLFWSNVVGNQMFAKIATHVFNTPTNSVSSEQSFSIQNTLHTKLRNVLHSEKVNKMTYTYRNGRILRTIESRVDNNGKEKEKEVESDLLHILSEEEEVELEDTLLFEEGVEGDDIMDIDNDDEPKLQEPITRRCYQEGNACMGAECLCLTSDLRENTDKRVLPSYTDLACRNRSL